MSTNDHTDPPPVCLEVGSELVDLVIASRPRDLGGFTVRRVLPSPLRRMVGPFIFFDHMGPVVLPPASGMDVRPHPHIALATVTFLFEGAIDHRDSVGSFQTVRPGDVNWMVAGRGIVHSERSPAAAREAGVRMDGIQSWVALPVEHEETEPRFEHHPAATIPRVTSPGAVLDVIAGTAYGQRSPVGVLSPTLYVHAQLEAGASVVLDAEHEERAVYVVHGRIACGPEDAAYEAGTMVVLRAGVPVTLVAREASRLMLVGGAPVGARHVWWNFVASSKERLEQAKAQWASDDVTAFPKVPGDDLERIPLPVD